MEQNLDKCLDVITKVTVTAWTKNHNKLNNLDYKNSGHTGFASEEQINRVQNNLSALEDKISTLAGVLQFQGTLESVDLLPIPTYANKGHVYIVGGNKEFASNGSIWIELGDENSYLLKATFEQEKENFQTKELNEPINIDGEEFTTVEGVLNRLKDGVSGEETTSIEVNVSTSSEVEFLENIKVNGVVYDTGINDIYDELDFGVYPTLDAIIERLDNIWTSSEGNSITPIGAGLNGYPGLPNSGFIEYMFLNSYLSKEEVHKIIKAGAYLNSNEEGGYTVLEFEDGWYFDFGWYITEDGEESSYIYTNRWGTIFQLHDENGFGYTGWDPYFIEYAPYEFEVFQNVTYADITENMLKLIYADGRNTITGLNIDGENYYFPNYADVSYGGEKWGSDLKINIKEEEMKATSIEGYVYSIEVDKSKTQQLKELFAMIPYNENYGYDLFKFGYNTAYFSHYSGDSYAYFYCGNIEVVFNTEYDIIEFYGSELIVDGECSFENIEGYERYPYEHQQIINKFLECFIIKKVKIEPFKNILIGNTAYINNPVEKYDLQFAPLQIGQYVDKIYLSRFSADGFDSDNFQQEFFQKTNIRRLYFETERHGTVTFYFEPDYGALHLVINGDSLYQSIYWFGYDLENIPEYVDIQGKLTYVETTGDEPEYNLDELAYYMGVPVEKSISTIKIGNEIYNIGEKEKIEQLTQEIESLKAKIEEMTTIINNLLK